LRRNADMAFHIVFEARGYPMKFSFRSTCGLCAVLVTSMALAQAPAPDAASQGAEAPATTKAQIQAERKVERKANRALSKRVQLAIYQSKGLSDAEISVFATARTGKVTLTGMITDEDQERRAISIASGVPGVTSVTSRLTLNEEGSQ
jgi:hyperosmotically inducible periplasmic protein